MTTNVLRAGTRTPTVAVIATLVVAALISGGCARDATTDEPSPSAASTEAVSSPPAVDDQAAEPGDDQVADDGSADDLAGTPVELFFRDGDTLGVVGVAVDDVLNVRAGPGVDREVVATVAPLGAVTATGSVRQLSRSFWAEVDTGERVGWVNMRFLGYLGQTDDVTSDVASELGDDQRAGNMRELGRAVARTRASTDPQSSIVVVAGPMIGDLGEVTVDVIGLGDDSASGVRLVVFGEPVDDGFELRSVEETAICGRGVTADGICV